MTQTQQQSQHDDRDSHSVAVDKTRQQQQSLMSDETFTQMMAANCIVVSGNISAGKSTLVEAFEKTVPRSAAVREPVENNPFLDAFYRDPKSVAFQMQMYLFAKRMIDYQHATMRVPDVPQP